MKLLKLYVLSAAGSICLAGAPAWSAGFTITPTFDSSILLDLNTASIQATINSALAVYNNTITNPVNINITFDENIVTQGDIGESSAQVYGITYSVYRAGLAANATKSANDTTALANLPVQANNPVIGSPSITLKAANLIALGGLGVANIDNSLNFVHLATQQTTPPGVAGPTKYSLFSTVQHEVDEILGLGSAVGKATTTTLPEDLFRYSSAAGVRSFTTGTAIQAFFSIDGTNDLVRFNQSATGDTGDWAGTATPQVQDAFGTQNTFPTLGTNEITALDVIGYNFTTAPEPGAAILFLGGSGILSLAGRTIRRRLADRG